MKILEKEIIWIIVLSIISYLIWHPFLPFSFSDFTSTIDINVHDTYFVIESANILITTTGLVFYFSYLLRMIFTKFKIILINSIFLFSNLFMIIIILSCVQVVKMIMIVPGTTIYPPLSSKPQAHQGNGFENLYIFFLSVLIVFIITFILGMIKTFITLKNNKKNQNT
ncbi:MAG: hypothetical protein ABI793_07765 [Flavobacterium sp.]